MNGLYTVGQSAFARAEINWESTDIRALLVDTAIYTVALASHTALADIIVGARIATSATLTGRTVNAGVLDADDTTFTAVSGATAGAIVLYVHTGDDATSTLLDYKDTASGLPVVPNGEDIIVRWDANGVIRFS